MASAHPDPDHEHEHEHESEQFTIIYEILCDSLNNTRNTNTGNTGNTVIYTSIGSAQRKPEEHDAIIGEPSQRALYQQLPPFIRNYLHDDPSNKVIVLIIDSELNDIPLIVDPTYDKILISKNTTLYKKPELSQFSVITIEESVRWAPPRHSSEKDIIDISNFVKNMIFKCFETKNCFFIESFTGDYMSNLRNWIESECNKCVCSDEILDCCLIGLTINGNCCFPDLSTDEYDIKIKYNSESKVGIHIDNPQKYLKHPIEYKYYVANGDRSLSIRLQKFMGVKIVVFCDSILTIARMAIIRKVNINNVNNTVYQRYINFTNETYNCNITIDDSIDNIFDVLLKILNKLQEYANIKDANIIDDAMIEEFKTNEDNTKHYKNYNNIKDKLTALFYVDMVKKD
jgi:hypothetical protein